MSEFFSFHGTLPEILGKIRAYLRSREGLDHISWVALALKLPFDVVYRAVCCDEGKTLRTDGRNVWLNGTKKHKRAEYEGK